MPDAFTAETAPSHRLKLCLNGARRRLAHLCSEVPDPLDAAHAAGVPSTPATQSSSARSNVGKGFVNRRLAESMQNATTAVLSRAPERTKQKTSRTQTFRPSNVSYSVTHRSRDVYFEAQKAPLHRVPPPRAPPPAAARARARPAGAAARLRLVARAARASVGTAYQRVRERFRSASATRCYLVCA